MLNKKESFLCITNLNVSGIADGIVLHALHAITGMNEKRTDATVAETTGRITTGTADTMITETTDMMTTGTIGTMTTGTTGTMTIETADMVITGTGMVMITIDAGNIYFYHSS